MACAGCQWRWRLNIELKTLYPELAESLAKRIPVIFIDKEEKESGVQCHYKELCDAKRDGSTGRMHTLACRKSWFDPQDSGPLSTTRMDP